TTLPKAKQLRPFAEKLITLARRQDVHSRRLTRQYIQDRKILKKLLEVIGPRFKDEKGGYTRIIPYRHRWGDGAQLAFIELKDFRPPEEPKEGKKKKAAAKQEEAAVEPAEEKKPKKRQPKRKKPRPKRKKKSAKQKS